MSHVGTSTEIQKYVEPTTTAERGWYGFMNIAFGAAYFSKIPAKAALRDLGLVELTGAEKFWYVLECVAFGAGYFGKVITKRALSEAPAFAGN
jgi:hypothetical protein